MDRLARLLDALLAPGVPLAIAAHACLAQLLILASAFLADAGSGGQQLERWWPGLSALAGFDRLDLDHFPSATVALAAAAGGGVFCGVGLGRRACGWPGVVLAASLVAVPWIAPAGRLAQAGYPGLLAPLAVVPAWLAAALVCSGLVAGLRR